LPSTLVIKGMALWFSHMCTHSKHHQPSVENNIIIIRWW
jgi:hypothetical protein